MTEDERRRYFRINDEVAINFTLLNEEYGGESIEPQVVDLNQEFHMSLEVQIRQAMSDIRGKSPQLAHVLDLLNQKINLLRSDDHKIESDVTIIPVNISACGISFPWHEDLKINQELMLNMYLQPKHELVHTEAYVAAVNRNTDPDTRQGEPYIVHLDFVNIHISYQELLIQHIVQRQGHQLRKKLETQS